MNRIRIEASKILSYTFAGSLNTQTGIMARVRSLNLPLLYFLMIYYSIIIFLAGYINVWEDEVYSLNTSSNGIQYAFYQSIHFEQQPPVYFVLLSIWRSLSESMLWARLFSVFIIFISQILLYNFIRKTETRMFATIASILFLLNPVTVYAILEIRLYSFIILLSLTLIILFYKAYYVNNLNYGPRILYITISILALFTQHFMGFLIFANAMVLIIGKKYKSFFTYALDMLFPLILIIIYVPQIAASAEAHTVSYPGYQRTIPQFLNEIRIALISRVFIDVFPFQFSSNPNLIRLVKAIILILLIVSINLKNFKNGLKDQRPLIIILSVSIMFFIILDYLFGIHSVNSKYTTVLFIPLILFFIFLSKSIKPVLLKVWIIVIAFAYISENVRLFHGLYKTMDIRSLVHYLETNETRSEPILIYRNIIAENVKLYYNGVNDIVPVPGVFEYDKGFDPTLWKINEPDLENLYSQLILYPAFYVVIDNSTLEGVSESRKVLLDFLMKNFKVVEAKTFKNNILLYKLMKNSPDKSI